MVPGWTFAPLKNISAFWFQEFAGMNHCHSQ